MVLSKKTDRDQTLVAVTQDFRCVGEPMAVVMVVQRLE